MEWLFSELWFALKSYINDSGRNIVTILKIRKKINKISKELKASILDSFQYEIYFNDLDKFLYINKIISGFIMNCTSTGVHKYKNIDSFIEENVNRFINQNPHYFAYKSTIDSTLKEIFLLTFDKINEVEDENIRVIINNLKEYSTVLENNLSCIESKIDSIGIKSNENTKKIISFMSLLQRLCKPPNRSIIKIPVWRFNYAKKKKNTGGNRPQGERAGVNAGIGHQRYVGYQHLVQGICRRYFRKRTGSRAG